MISAVDILSFDTQYQANLPAPAEVGGPPFSDYLSRAEDTRQSAQYSSGPELREYDRTVENGSAGEASGAANTEYTEQYADPYGNKDASGEKSPSRASSDGLNADADGKVKKSRKEASEAADKSIKSENRLQKNTREKSSDTTGADERTQVKNPLSKNAAGFTSVSAEKGIADSDSSKEELSAVLRQSADVPAAESETVQLSVLADGSEEGMAQAETASLSGAAAGASGTELKSSGSDNTVRSGKDDAIAAGIIGDPRKNSTDKTKAAQAKGPEIEVVDLRGKKAGSLEGTASRMRGDQARPEVAESRDSGSVPLRTEGDSTFREQVLVIGSDSSKEDSSSLKSFDTTSRAAGELSRALRDGGNSEILKKAQFMLKEQDQGEIKLILKPEKLGEVRIRLNLNDKHIGGRIIVENSSVREVFQENMEQLNRSFREHGFQTAGLEVTVGGRDGRHSGQRDRDSSQVSSRRVSEVFDEQVPRLDSDLFSDSRVNVYV